MNMYDLGRAIGEVGAKVWERTRRPLSPWETGMMTVRNDAWAPAFGGVYRFALPYPIAIEMEADGPLGRLHIELPQEGAVPSHGSAPVAAYTKLIRLALFGGGMGVAGGERVTVDAAAAVALVGQLKDQPLTETWRLSRVILSAHLFGRAASPAEIEGFSIPAASPVVPAWALGVAGGTA